MTSPSRKKRLTTPRSSPAATAAAKQLTGQRGALRGARQRSLVAFLLALATLAAPLRAEEAGTWTGNAAPIKPATAQRTTKQLRWKRPSRVAAPPAEAPADREVTLNPALVPAADSAVVPVSYDEPAALPKARKPASRIIRVQQLEAPQPTLPEPTLPEAEAPAFDLPDREPPSFAPPEGAPPTTVPPTMPRSTAPPAEMPESPTPPSAIPTTPPTQPSDPAPPTYTDEPTFAPDGPDERFQPGDENLRVQGPDTYGPCPTPRDVKPITQITNSIEAEGGKFPPECTLGDEPFVPRAWAMTTYTWKASGLCHKPLYFEDVNLERYGHSLSPCLQPIISGAHFFATIPVLPYKMGIETPCECIYPLGYYRPGSCSPHLLYPIPLSLRGALVEGAVATGLVFLLP